MERGNGFGAAVGGDDVELCGLDNKLAGGDRAGVFAINDKETGPDHTLDYAGEQARFRYGFSVGPARRGEGEDAVGVHGGGGGEQGAGVGVLGVAEDAVGGAVFDDASVLHDGDAVSGLIGGLGDDG